jgi:hypothetical protein
VRQPLRQCVRVTPVIVVWNGHAQPLADPYERFALTLLLDSGVLRDQYLNERTKQCFASLADVVHKLDEPQVEGQFLL